jgi:hypothetical protein
MEVPLRGAPKTITVFIFTPINRLTDDFDRTA